MALIRATCSDCGDVELRSRNIIVRTCAETNESTYVFRCPVCWMIEARFAELHVVDVLVAAGCAREVWHLPAELSDSRRTDGMRLTHDDVLDFHWFLADANTPRIIEAARPVSAADQQRFVDELREADSSVIARELSA